MENKKIVFSLGNLKTHWQNKQLVFESSQCKVNWQSFEYTILKRAEKLRTSESDDWGLYAENPLSFCIGFWSLLEAGKNIHLFSVFKGDSDIPVLTDLKGASHFPLEILVPDKTQGTLHAAVTTYTNTIILHTSGSTGNSKIISKKPWQINQEILVLQKCFGLFFKKALCCSTVSPQHFYGLLFSIILPLSLGTRVYGQRIDYPESLLVQKDLPCCLIGSPAFYKRLTALPKNAADRVYPIIPFSSGGFLPPACAEKSSVFFNSPVLEIYGSTETGGIAWKKSLKHDLWHCFDGVMLKETINGNVILESNYLEEPYILDDAVELKENRKFHLLGRIDSIVKVEDKRVSLRDMEVKIIESGLASDAIALKMEDRRQYVALIIELNGEGKIRFSGMEKKEINTWFRKWLESSFHPTVLPKKWRYPGSMPRNSQGKLNYKECEAMFRKEDILQKGSFENPFIYSRNSSGEELTVVLSFPAEYRYFQGHFPELKILPAVAQMDWALKEAGHLAEMVLPVKKIPRFKLKNPIFPGQKVILKLSFIKNRQQIQFQYQNAGNGEVISIGKILLEDS